MRPGKSAHPPPIPKHSRALPMKVGTRGSPLALWQTRHFLATVSAACPVMAPGGGAVFEEHVIATSGDRIQDRRLAEIGGKGLFAKEIHEALADGRVDFAVHSLKDLETELPAGIVLACTLKREDARDALLLTAPGGVAAADPCACLAPGALVGTASVRRQSQLLAARPDLRVTTIRGNVQTRLGKVRGGEVGATLLALAGLRRMGLEAEAALVLDPEVMLPAAGQGIVGITVRADDTDLRELLAAVEDAEAKAVSTAERALLAALDGSCRTPIGALATIKGGKLYLVGEVLSPDGKIHWRREDSIALPGDAAALGRKLGAQIRAEAGEAFIQSLEKRGW